MSTNFAAKVYRPEEKRLLQRLCDAHKDRLEKKGNRKGRCSGTIRTNKQEAWKEITYDYNQSSILLSGQRTQDQLMKLWHNMKVRHRRKQRESHGTSNGPESEMTDHFDAPTGHSSGAANTAENGLLDFTVLIPDEHVGCDAKGMARLEHRRKMQMLEEGHRLHIEKLRWDLKLSRARYEREFGAANKTSGAVIDDDEHEVS